MATKLHYVWLSIMPQITPFTAARLIEVFGSAEGVYAADRKMLLENCTLTKKQVDAICNKSTEKAEEIIEECTRKGIQIVTISDSSYPDRLRAIVDPPLVLYIKGRWPDFDTMPAIAVVGTRDATPYGIETAEAIGKALGKAGYITVSGMALGNDGAAHRGALRAQGLTVAVFAGGVDICYPMKHQAMMGDILLSGAIVSEHPPGTEHKGEYFPQRNRIISGLCVATVIVEAKDLRSGSTITARRALDQGRDVYAVPGAIGAKQSAGCNELIERGEAAILTGPDLLVRTYSGLLREKPDMVKVREAFFRQTGQTAMPAEKTAWDDLAKREEENGRKMQQAAKRKRQLPEGLGEDETEIAKLVLAGACTAEDIMERSGINPARVMALITMMEMDGILKRENGKLIASWN